jgi:hypothetical protein
MAADTLGAYNIFDLRDQAERRFASASVDAGEKRERSLAAV